MARPRWHRAFRRFGWAGLVVLGLGALAFAAPSVMRLHTAPAAPTHEAAAPPQPVRPSVAGVRLTVPQDLVRFAHHRRDADLARLDLALAWPSLSGAGEGTPASSAPGALASLIVITIARSDEALAPDRRLAAIYQRFLEPAFSHETHDLVARRFKGDTGYDGESLVYDPARPGDFFARCAPATDTGPATCLRERRIGSLDIVIRFPRSALSEWRRLERALSALLGAIGIADA